MLTGRGVSRGVKALSLCVVVLAAAGLAAAVEPARACSCVPPEPWSYLERADGAFVGRLVSRKENGQGRAVLVFRVERAVKGKIGETVEVETASSGAACGIETSIGRRIGLFLMREGDGWFGHLCWQVAPEDLLAAASLPAPNGTGPVAMFVGGRFGPARTLALDAKGRTLAYGIGAGHAWYFSVCPGGRKVAELVEVDFDKFIIAIRELPTLRLVRQQPLKLEFAGPLRCTSTEGDRLVVFVGSGPGLEQRARLVKVTPKGATTIWRGWAFDASLTERLAYVTELNDGLLAVDPASRSVKRLATLPGEVHYLIPNAERTRFASVAYTEGVGNPRLVVVDIRTRPASVRTVPLPNATGDVLWPSHGRLALLQQPTALIFGPDLRVVSRFRWQAEHGALVGSTAFGVHRTGRLVSAKLPSGPTRLVRRLPGRPEVIVSARG
jgi:hypothetical protein